LNDESDKELFEEANKEIDFIDETSERFEFTSIPEEKKLEEKDLKTQPKIVSSSNSKLLATKDLSQLTGLSSRKVNSWLADNKLMYKKEDDWITTKRGKEVGGIEKNGQYGQFVIWPEEIGKQIIK
jgi:hypothetical protein